MPVLHQRPMRHARSTSSRSPRNPAADLSQLYLKEMAALACWAEAEKKALTNDPAVAKAQANLDTAAQVVRSELATTRMLLPGSPC